jgi:hypothetical protein
MSSILRLSLLTILILLSAWLTSCEFKLHDIPDEGIEKPSDPRPPIVMNLNDYHDTIKLGYITNFNYTITGTANKVLDVEISIGGKVIHKYVADSQQPFYFTLDPAAFSDGKYNLNIQIITSTGTGSIAEKFGFESYAYELNWPVIIDQEIPRGTYNITFEKVHNPEGLKLTWPQFNHVNFVKYVVYRQYSAFQQTPVQITEITDPLQSTFIDKSFWEGQDGTYFIRIITPFGNHDGISCTFEDMLTGFSANWHNDGTLDITWNKAQNVETFGSYYVFDSYGLFPIDSSFIADREENHVTFHDSGFANGIIIYLGIMPKGVDISEYKKLKLTQFIHYTQPDLPLFNKANIVNNHDFTLLSKQYLIYRYFPDERRIDDSLSVNLNNPGMISVSNDGNSIAYYQGNDFYVRRTEDFATTAVIRVPEILYPGFVCFLSLSDNDRLVASDGLDHVLMYSTATGQLIRKDSVHQYYWSDVQLEISPDGTKMAVPTGMEEVTFFSLEPSGWVSLGKITQYISQVFYSKDGGYIFIVTYDRLEKRKTSDFGLVSQFTLAGGFFGSVDPDRERLLHSVSFGPDCNIVDLNSGQILKSPNLGAWNNSEYIIFKNHIITSGRQLELLQF